MSTITATLPGGPTLTLEVHDHDSGGLPIIDCDSACHLAEAWRDMQGAGRPDGPRGWTVGECDSDPIIFAYVEPAEPGRITFCEWQTIYDENDESRWDGERPYWSLHEFPFRLELGQDEEGGL